MLKVNRLKELRKNKHFSIEQLSKKLHEKGIQISPASISKYERGERNPKIENWNSLAKFFNVSVSYITGASDEPGKDTGRLQSIREEKGMSYQQVADAYNQEADQLSVFDHKEPHINAETIQAIENGKYKPSQHEWQLLAWGLDVPEFYLAGHSNDKVGWQEWANATDYPVDQLKSEVKRLVDTGRLDGNSDKQHQISYAVQSLDNHAPTTTSGTIHGVQNKLLEIRNYINKAFVVKKNTPLKPGSKIKLRKPGDWHIRSDMDEQAYKKLIDIINKARYEIGQIAPKK